MRLFRWFINPVRRLDVIAALLFLGGTGVFAAQTTSWDVTNNPQMYLDASISSSQTANVKIAALKRNGSTVIFPNMTGGVLRIRQGTRVEDISYTSATVNATTKAVTLAGVVRDICWNQALVLTTCGNGQAFSKGATVELSTDSRLFNFKANKDRAQTFTARQTFGSGVTLTGSGYALELNRLTTTERDALTNVKNGTVIYNKTTGLINQYLTGAWSAVGTDATPNATESAAGKFLVTSFLHLANRSQTGATAALNALTPRWLVKNGSGATSAYLLPQLGGNGVIATSLGGTGTGGTAGVASGSILVYQKNNSPKPLYATSTNQVILSTDGKNWNAGSAPMDVNVLTGSTASTNRTFTNPQALVNFDQTGSLLPAQLNTKGAIIHVYATGTVTEAGANGINIALRLGGTTVATCTTAAITSSSIQWAVNFYLVVRTAGAGGVIEGSATGMAGTKTCSSANTNTTSFDTTATYTANIAGSFQGSNAGNNIGPMHMLIIDGQTP